MNFRVHLQYEFTQLGLDAYLENKLRFNESDRLQVQIQAYMDNQFDVQQLLQDADAKNETLLDMERLREELGVEKEKFGKAQDEADDALNKISELQNENCQIKVEYKAVGLTEFLSEWFQLVIVKVRSRNLKIGMFFFLLELFLDFFESKWLFEYKIR